MPKYRVTWTEEHWYNQEIEADNPDQAVDMVMNDEWPDPYGYEVQDSIEVEEVDD